MFAVETIFWWQKEKTSGLNVSTSILNATTRGLNVPTSVLCLTNFFKGVYLINKKPSTKDFRKCLSVLEKQIQQISPSKIIFFGADAKRVIKKEFEVPTLYFIHPSAIWAKTIILEKRFPYYKKIKEFLESD